LLAALAIEKFSQTYEGVPVSGRAHVAVEGAASRSFEWKQPQDGAGPRTSRSDDTERSFKTSADVAAPRLLEPWPASGSGMLDVAQQGFGTTWVWPRSRAAVPAIEPVVAGYELQRTVTPVSQRHPDRWSVGHV